MSWMGKIYRFVLMLIFLLVVTITGWSELAERNLNSLQSRSREEIYLKREFEKKAKVANNLPAYQEQYELIVSKRKRIQATLQHFDNKNNTDLWCNKLAHAIETEITCRFNQEQEHEFYSEKSVYFKILAPVENLANILATMTSAEKVNFDAVNWRNLSISRPDNLESLIIDGEFVFFTWREENE